MNNRLALASALLCALLLEPLLGVADESESIVATNIAGSVSVQSTSGTQRDIVSTQVLHSGDIVSTGSDSLAVVRLADVGRVLLGPATTATTFSRGADLSLQVAAGTVCVHSEKPVVNISTGSLSVMASTPAIFDLEQNSGDSKIAIYQGAVFVKSSSGSTKILRAGTAATTSSDGVAHSIPLASLSQDFAALNCPESAVPAPVLPAARGAEPQAQPAPSSPLSTPSSGGGGAGGG